MLKVRDIMTRNVLTLSPAATLREAMALLASHHVSGAPVVSGGKLVGVVTTTDLLASLERNAPGEHDVSEVMYRAPLVTLPADAAVDAAADLMKNLDIHRVLVTENDRLVGVVSALDVARAVAEHRLTARA